MSTTTRLQFGLLKKSEFFEALNLHTKIVHGRGLREASGARLVHAQHSGAQRAAREATRGPKIVPEFVSKKSKINKILAKLRPRGPRHRNGPPGHAEHHAERVQLYTPSSARVSRPGMFPLPRVLTKIIDVVDVSIAQKMHLFYSPGGCRPPDPPLSRGAAAPPRTGRRAGGRRMRAWAGGGRRAHVRARAGGGRAGGRAAGEQTGGRNKKLHRGKGTLNITP